MILALAFALATAAQTSPVSPMLDKPSLMPQGQVAPSTLFQEAQGRKLDTVSIVAGSCKALTVKGADAATACQPTLLSNAYSDGRVSYIFVSGTPLSGQQSVISFFVDDDHEAPVAGGPPQAPLDAVLIGTKDGTQTLTGKGGCSVVRGDGDLLTITCQATTSAGDAYGGTFVSDGKPPQVRRF